MKLLINKYVSHLELINHRSSLGKVHLVEFSGLNTKSEVTVMRCRNVIEAVRSFSLSLEKMKEEIKREMNKLSPTYSEVIQSWISNQGW